MAMKKLSASALAKSWSRKKRPLAERFWEKIIKGFSENDCWQWDGAKTGHGYGVIGLGVGKKMIMAHRLSYQLHLGEIPIDLLVCHTCDNPECCNPKHLFLGSYSDNMQDCKAKGRFSNPPINNRFGTANHMFRLNDAVIGQIKLEYSKLPLVKSGKRKKLGAVAELASKFGIHKSYLQIIVSGGGRFNA